MQWQVTNSLHNLKNRKLLIDTFNFQDQDAAVSRVHKEEWQGIPETFQDPVEEGIPDEGKNAWNARNLELKNRKRASRYESFKADLEDLDQ